MIPAISTAARASNPVTSPVTRRIVATAARIHSAWIGSDAVWNFESRSAATL